MKKFILSMVAVFAVLAIGVVFSVNALRFENADAAYAANTQKHESNLAVSPAVITEVESAEQLNAMLNAKYMPSTLIYRINGNNL